MTAITNYITGCNNGRYVGEQLILNCGGTSSEVIVVDVNDIDHTFCFTTNFRVNAPASKKKKAQWKRKPVWIGG